jgi:hypothetical protein
LYYAQYEAHYLLDHTTMRTTAKRQAVGVAIGAAIAAILLLVGASVVRRDPTYEGKTVSEWVWQYAWTNRQGLPHAPPTVAMQKIGSRAVPLLITELQRQNSDRDSHRLRLRAWLATPDWIRHLLRWREPPDLGDAYKLRESAAMTLGSLGTEARSAIPHLRAALRDPTPHVRLHAAYAMWQVDHSLASEVVPVLMQLHNDPHNLKYYTSLYFGSIGAEASAAVPLLRETLSDPNDNIREAAKSSLQRIELAEAKGQNAIH